MGLSSSKTKTPTQTERILSAAGLDAKSVSAEELALIQNLPNKQQKIRELNEIALDTKRAVKQALQAAKVNQDKFSKIKLVPLDKMDSASISKLSETGKAILVSELAKISNNHKAQIETLLFRSQPQQRPQRQQQQIPQGEEIYSDEEVYEQEKPTPVNRVNRICGEWKENKKANKKNPVNPITGNRLKPKGPTAKALNKVCKSVKKSCKNPDINPRTKKPHGESSRLKYVKNKICYDEE